MAIVTTDDKHYKNIAQAIRDKTGGNAQYKPGEMADGVGEVYDAGYANGQASGGGAVIDPDKILENTITGTMVSANDVSEISHKCTVVVDKDSDVTVCGKNLIDPTEYMKSSGNTTLDGDVFTTTFVSGGAYVNRWADAKKHPAGTYTVSVIPVNGDAYLTVFVYDHATGEIIKRQYTTDGYNFTFTASVPCRITICGLVGYFGTYSYKLQLEVGKTATEYAPYNAEKYTVSAEAPIEVDSICPNMTVYADNGAVVTFGYNQSWGIVYGKQAEYDRFWDDFQDYGTRRDYKYAFAGYGWSDPCFKPKYPCGEIVQAVNMFNYCCITYIDVDLDFSEATSFSYAFANSTYLKRIKSVKFNNNIANANNRANMFTGTKLLEDITINGTINFSISFSECSKLSDGSVQSIIDSLVDLTGQTAQTITFHATVGAKLTDAQKATITAKNWTLVY